MCIFTGCEDMANEEVLLQNEGNLQEDVSLKSIRNLSPSKYSFDEYYSVSLSNYEHIKQVGRTCGPTSYVVARKMKNPSYPNAYSNISIIHSTLGGGDVSLGQLYYYNDQTAKSLYSKPSGNNLWSSRRTELKNFIKESIRDNKPVILFTGINMALGGDGHCYIIVELFLNDEGTGSVVGVKDVLSSSSYTTYFDYTDLLNSNWYRSRESSGIGSESYSAMCFE